MNGVGAIVIGLTCSAIVWFAWNYLSKLPPFNKVDDALGVVYTHGIAGLFGGLLVGFLADPNMIIYLGLGKSANIVPAAALLYGGSGRCLLLQAGAALTIIVWDGLVTFLLLRGIGLFVELQFPTRSWRSATSRCTARRPTPPRSWPCPAWARPGPRNWPRTPSHLPPQKVPHEEG